VRVWHRHVLILLTFVVGRHGLIFLKPKSFFARGSMRNAFCDATRPLAAVTQRSRGGCLNCGRRWRRGKFRKALETYQTALTATAGEYSCAAFGVRHFADE